MIALPTFAFAQTSDGVTKASSPKAATPAVGTYKGRSANSTHQSANPAKDTDGLHPNGDALKNTAKP